MMGLKNSKRVRIIGRRIGEGISKTMTINKNKITQIKFIKIYFRTNKKKSKKKSFNQSFIKHSKFQYPSLEFALMKIEKYTEIKFQVMNAYSTLIQRYYRNYVEYSKNKRTTVTIIEQSNSIIMETVHHRGRVNYCDYNLDEKNKKCK